LLAQRLGLQHISTGDMFRQAIQERSPVGRRVERLVNNGELVPDALVGEVVRAHLGGLPACCGFVLDGFPRTVAQAEWVSAWLARRGLCWEVVNLRVDREVIVSRIGARRQCPQCGASYNLVFNPPQRDEVCDRDQTPLIIREDDQEAVVRQRFEAYRQQTAPLLDYFRKAGGAFHDVDGSTGGPDGIARRIVEQLRLG